MTTDRSDDNSPNDIMEGKMAPEFVDGRWCGGT